MRTVIARTARKPPIPMPTFAPLLRLLEVFGGAVVVLDGKVEADMDEARDDIVPDDEVRDGTSVFRVMVVEAAVALVVAAIVYPAAE